jgi:cytochrome c-type biogenesis protein CcmH
MTLRTGTTFYSALAGLDPAIHVFRLALCKQRRGPPGQARGKRDFGARLYLAVPCILFALWCWTSAAHAVRPDEMLADPTLEARARDIGKELRCLVCRNQSIDDSEADLAHDLRVLVRQRLAAGDTDRQVVDYIVSRYGDFVLLKPPFEPSTWLLWGGPLLVLVIGAIGVRRFVRRQAAAPAPPPLSADEERRLAAMLDDKARS